MSVLIAASVEEALEVAWERAFIQTSNFKTILSDYQVIYGHYSVTASKLAEQLLHQQNSTWMICACGIDKK